MSRATTSSSPFGAGWWVAGLEQLVPLSDGRKLWVGGDGSTRVFTSAGTNAWTSPGLTHPERLTYDAAIARYVREVPGGVKVYFDTNGKHLSTRNRQDDTTYFDYDGSNRLYRIRLPVPSGTTRPTYTFTYGPSSVTITAPPIGSVARQTILDQQSFTGTANSAPGVRIWRIRDPDSHAVTFAAFHASVPSLITTRADRRGKTVSYAWDSDWRVSQASQNPGFNQQVITLSVQWLTTRAASPLAPDSAFTLIDGPRTDVVDQTRYWPDRFGAAVHLRDALGHDTRLYREFSTFPGLVTRVESPVHAGGQSIQTATYDDRGNTTTSTKVDPYDDGRDAITRYEYANQSWPDFVTKIVLPERDSIMIGYDVAAGNRIWQQDGRGSSSRIVFDYYASTRLFRASKLPLSPRDSVAYDALGNLAQMRSPMGFWTTYRRDAIGRDTLVLTPNDSAQTEVYKKRVRSVYDVMDRIQVSETIGPSYQNVPAQTIHVVSSYDAEGRLLSTSRSSSPDIEGIGTIITGWRYDDAGRRIVERAPDGARDSTIFGPAGNADSLFTRRGHVLTMQYDALGQLKASRTPAVSYASSMKGIPTRLWEYWLPDLAVAYPFYPNNDAGGYTILADTAVFDYDALGNLIVADNSAARVSRSYYPNGQLSSETQDIRTVAPLDSAGSFNQHIYTIRYSYDLDGRRTQVWHPAQLVAGASRTSTSYSYDPGTGLLSQAHDPVYTGYHIAYDLNGRQSSLNMQGNVVQSLDYSGDGALVGDTIYSPTHATWGDLRATTYRYDGAGRVIARMDAGDSPDTLTATYSGIGHLVGSVLRGRGRDSAGGLVRYTATESFTYDALGNFSKDSTATRYVYAGTDSTAYHYRVKGYVAGVGRLANAANPIQRDTFFYDEAGNTVFSTQSAVLPYSTANYEERASYYAADGKLRAADYRFLGPESNDHAFYRSTFEEYRYDALGRRVLVRSRNWCERKPDGYNGLCRMSKIRRTVWDGSDELWEIQMPGEDTSAFLENDTAVVRLPIDKVGTNWVDPNPYFGRVLYIHGLAVDRPLGLVRFGYGDVFDNAYQEQELRELGPFSLMLVWNPQGSEAEVGLFSDGNNARCVPIDPNNPPPDPSKDPMRCIYVDWPLLQYAYDRDNFTRREWHGSLAEDKRDDAGTYYRRNRVYDPATGSFTQEDPIGLAGGLNLYGYANGDPVSYSDPFGLCPEEDRNADGLCPGGLTVEQWKAVEDEAAHLVELSEQSSSKAEYGRYILGTDAGEGYLDPRLYGGGSNTQVQGTPYYGGDLPAGTPGDAVAFIHTHPYGTTTSGGRVVSPLGLSRADQLNAMYRGVPVFAASPQGLRVVLPNGAVHPKTWPLGGGQ